MEEIRKFFEELSTVDAPAYVEVPLSLEEWEQADDKMKTLTAFLFLLWKAGYPLREVYRGWFYCEESPFILRMEDETFLLIAKDRPDGKLYRVVFNETLSVPSRLTEFTENSYLLGELKYFAKPNWLPVSG